MQREEPVIAHILLPIALARPPILLLKAHSLHALLDILLRSWRSSDVELAQGDAAVLVVGSHLLPFLDSRYSGPLDGILRIGNWRVCCHVADLDEGNWDEPRAAEPPYRLRHEPLWVRLCDDNYCLSRLCLQLVGPLGLEVVHDYSVDHGAIFDAHLGNSQGVRSDGGCGRNARGRGLSVSGIVVGIVGGTRRGSTDVGIGTVALRTAEGLEVGDGHKASGVWQGRVAGFIPVVIILSTNDVEEIAPREAELLTRPGIIIVQRSNHLLFSLVSVPARYP